MPLGDRLSAWAMPALSDVAALTIGVSYLLLYWAGSTLFGGLLRAMANNIPFVGGYIGDALASTLSSVNAQAAKWVDGAISSVVRVVLYVPQAIVAVGSTVVGAFEWLIGQVLAVGAHVSQVALIEAGDVGAIGGKLLSLSGLVNLAQSAAADASGFAHWVSEVNLPAQLSHLAGAVEQDIANAVGQAEAAARTGLAGAESSLRSDIALAEAGIRTEIAAEVAGIQTDIADVQAGLIADIAHYETWAYGTINDSIAGIEHAIESALGVDGIVDVIDMVKYANEHPTEAARDTAAAARAMWDLSQPLVQVMLGQRPAPGLGAPVWPTRPAAPAPPHAPTMRPD
jgi:hypothetical protein